jgi:hypothetical protein
MEPTRQCAHCKHDIVDRPSHCPACGADLTSPGGLQDVVEPVPEWLSTERGQYGDSYTHNDAWWARLLDSYVFTPWVSPSGWRVATCSVATVAFGVNALFNLENGHQTLFVILLGGALSTGLATRAMYLRVMLQSYSVSDVSLFDLNSIQRRAPAPAQPQLMQWKRTMVAQLVVACVTILILVVLVVMRLAGTSM